MSVPLGEDAVAASLSRMNDEQTKRDLSLLLQSPDQWPDYDDYQPLDQSKREIRLLRIWHTSDGNQIHASVEHHSLDEDPQYEALSYCWGLPAELLPIYINGQAVFVRRTLWTFINSLCHKHQSLPVWFDVLCIDQKNVVERNSQVAMMGDIYRQATRTISWIGEPDTESEYAFAFLQNEQNTELLNSPHFKQHQQRVTPLILKLAHRPYWERLWIVQEIVLAREVIVACGARRITLENLARQFSGDKEIALTALCETRKDLTSSMRDYSLYDAVLQFGNRSCTDIRDKLFGLISLSTNTDLLTVDYDRDFGDLILDVAGFRWSSSVIGQDLCTKGQSTSVNCPTNTPEVSDEELYMAISRAYDMYHTMQVDFPHLFETSLLVQDRSVRVTSTQPKCKFDALLTEKVSSHKGDPSKLQPSLLRKGRMYWYNGPDVEGISQGTWSERSLSTPNEWVPSTWILSQTYESCLVHPFSMWVCSIPLSCSIDPMGLLVSCQNDEVKLIGTASLPGPMMDMDQHLIWKWLVEMHEIQICRDISTPALNATESAPEIVDDDETVCCRFHYSKIAVLLLSFKQLGQSLLYSLGEMRDMHQTYRQKIPHPGHLCACKHDGDMNRAKIATIRKVLERRIRSTLQEQEERIGRTSIEPLSKHDELL